MNARVTKAAIGPAAVLAAVGTGAGLWYQLFRRPLPKTSGRLRLRGLDAPVEVLRDRFGVPHVRARSATDACFALGLCHGQDRLWQLEFFRRATAGRLAEFAGADALPADLLMRTLGMRRVAEREERDISTLLRSFLDAYAAGINAAIDSAAALPVEFQMVRLEPEPWTAIDLLAASKLMAFGLSTNWELELLRAQLVRDAGAERAERLEPRYPRGNPIVTAPGEVWTGEGTDLLAQIARVRDTLGLGAHAGGSNNWVVSGARSVTGRPLLACDPHLTTTIPDLWYEADVACDEFRVRGATLPTNPFPVFGQTATTAWGFTNVMADTQDLFAERLNADDARLYEFEGEWRRAEVIREEITVKGRGNPEAIDVTVTHHGPIVNAALGADGRAAAGAVLDRVPAPVHHGVRLSHRARSQRGRDRAGDRGPFRAAPQHALRGQRGEHRLSACRSHPDPERRLSRSSQARLDGRVRMGRRRSPTTSFPGS